MGNDELQRTAHASIPSRFSGAEDGRLEVDPYWLVTAPALILGVLALAWGSLLLFVSPPAFLLSLPTPLEGIDLLALGLFLLLTPVGMRALLDDRRRRALDDQFPDFLSDLAANRRAGFTLAEAVRLAAHSDYGPLTPEVRTMAAHLSWNVPFEEAIERFAERVDTPLVVRSTTLVLEAERSGGHITDVLSAVARDAREIRRLDRERRLSMRAYTVVMYVTFLVFLAVVAVLQSQMLPSLVAATDVIEQGPIPTTATSLEAYRTFFYTAALVQALGSGSMAGFMARGRVAPGLIHAAVMVLVTIATFSVLLA